MQIILASCSFPSLGLNKLLSNLFLNMPTSFTSRMVTSQVSYSQKERQKITLSHFNAFNQLKYLTQQSDVCLIYVMICIGLLMLNDATNDNSIVYY
jgi:hypothetical protein